MNGEIKVTIQNELGSINFFHPQSNSLPSKLLFNLAKEITQLGANNDVKVILLKSEGDKTFCSGASFDELIAISNFEQGLHFFSGFAHVINAIRTVQKLVIARVQGKAIGGGVGIACSADYTFAVKAASVKLSELAVGIGPFVVAPAVERKIGKAAFGQMTINATEWQTAEWAQKNGMYADIYDDATLMDEAINVLIQKLLKSNPEAMQHIKQILWEGTEHWNQLLIDRAKISGKLVLSDFTKQAIQSFKAK